MMVGQKYFCCSEVFLEVFLLMFPIGGTSGDRLVGNEASWPLLEAITKKHFFQLFTGFKYYNFSVTVTFPSSQAFNIL